MTPQDPLYEIPYDVINLRWLHKTNSRYIHTGIFFQLVCRRSRGKMSTETLTLNSGHKMPVVGLGTWQAASADECKDALRAALDAGYRHIDTAAAYRNEQYIGEVLQEYFKNGKLKREDIFITTKLWVTFHDKDQVTVGLDQSLKNLQLEYVDLYLIHCPFAYRNTGKGAFYPVDEDNKPAFKDVKVEETWKGMEACVKAGKAKSIGVSNFTIKQVERICKIATVKPSTNQVECHIYLQQKNLFKFLKEKNITLTAYSPFGSPGRPASLKKEGQPEVLDDPVAKELAAKYNKTVGQILLRFLVQRGMLVIPKSIKPERLRQNIDVFNFKLTDAEMTKLEGLDKNLRYFRGENFKGHPEFNEAELYAPS